MNIAMSGGKALVFKQMYTYIMETICMAADFVKQQLLFFFKSEQIEFKVT